ncbi:MAG: hypothetical protein JXJ20_03705 [Anaerolineae bacterium]|nr:hypothetical protein [Anaerolineae bacterium]
MRTQNGSPAPGLLFLIAIISLVSMIGCPQPTLAQSPENRIQPGDLTYLGAFRLPDSPGMPDDVNWTWNGWSSGMAYYPDGDPGGPADGYPGSLFGVGHDWTQYISEITIPAPVISAGKDADDLNTAQTLQPFTNIRDEVFDLGTYWELPRVGLAYLPPHGAQTTGKLYFSWAGHDPGSSEDTGPTHGWSELDLSDPQAAGPWRVGGYVKYVTSDYMFDIPAAWADAYTPGMYLATGRYREGGQGSMGPSLFALGPWNDGNPPPANSTLTAIPLLLYGNVTDGNPAMTGYQHCANWSGGAWLTTGDKSAVTFIGTRGQGNCWYGCADGTDEPPWPDDCNRGFWADSYVGQILFYDPADLAAVAQGSAPTWEPQPYATLNIDEHLYNVTSPQQQVHLGAAAFDRANGLLYVFEPLADEDKSLVHVWRVQPPDYPPAGCYPAETGNVVICLHGDLS